MNRRGFVGSLLAAVGLGWAVKAQSTLPCPECSLDFSRYLRSGYTKVEHRGPGEHLLTEWKGPLGRMECVACKMMAAEPGEFYCFNCLGSAWNVGIIGDRT